MASDSKRRRLVVEEVLADTVRPRPSAEELAELIQRVNPTGHSLGPAEERQRYRAKASLQSLLLRRHPELVRVQSDDGELLEISLAGTGRHAAHVPIDELDEDVRAWARRVLLDRDDADTSSTTRVATHSSRSDPLAIARAARDRGAFDDALASFETALTQTSGRASRIALVAELLDLFVGSLWDDAGALHLAHRLRHEPDVLAHPSVRAPLALAAARSGDRPRARALLLDARGAHASAAWAELGMAALADKHAEDARRALDRLSALEPTHPTVSELRTAIEALAREEATLAEAGLVRRLSTAQGDEREALAREHARRWPKSPAALRVIAEADAARRAERIASSMARVATARAPSERLAAMRAARSEGATGLDEEIAALHQVVEDELRTRARDELALALQGDDDERALEAWLDADPHVRGEQVLSPLRARAASLVLVHATRRTRDTLRAALCCASAEAHEAAGDLVAASRALTVGGRAAMELAELGGLLERLERARAKERDLATQAAIDAAEEALSAGDEERAAVLLGSLARGAGRELGERIARARLHRANTARFELVRAEGDVPEARFLALGLSRHEPARWRAEVDRLDAQMASFFDLRQGTDAVALADFADRMAQSQGRLVSPDGRELVLVNGAARHVFVRIVDLERGVVVRHAHLRDPRPGHDSNVTHAVFDGEHIRWGTSTAQVFTLHASLERGLVVMSLASLVGEGIIVEDVLPTAGGETAWLIVRALRDASQRAIVVDLERGDVVREIDDVTLVSHAASEGAARVLQLSEGAVVVHDTRGLRLGGIRLDGSRFPHEADVVGGRLHVLHEQEEAGADELALRWSVTSDVKADNRWCGVLGADPDAPMSVVALHGGAGIIAFSDDTGERLLAAEIAPGRSEKPPGAIEDLVKTWRALDPSDAGADEARVRLRAECMGHQGFAVQWDVPSSREALLATNLRGQANVVLAFEPDAGIWRVTSTEAPRLIPRPDEDTREIWSPWALDSRPTLPGENVERSVYPPHMVLGPDDAWRDEHYAPGHVLVFVARHSTHARLVVPRLLESANRHPRSASVVAELVQSLVRNDDFQEARSWIDRLFSFQLPSDVRSWAERVRGLVAIRCGDVVSAIASWRASIARGDLPDDTSSALRAAVDAYEGVGEGRLQTLLDAMSKSDACRVRGDLVGAISALDVSAVWVAREGHALARLADLWLARTPTTAAERFAKARALSAAASDLIPLLKFPPRAEAWDRERIREVTRRASDSLGSSTSSR